MAYQTLMDLGHFATRYRFVELWINERYKGVYIFSEKIKRDKDRVDIAKLTPEMNFGDSNSQEDIYLKSISRPEAADKDSAFSFSTPAHPIGQYIFFQYEYPEAGRDNCAAEKLHL